MPSLSRRLVLGRLLHVHKDHLVGCEQGLVFCCCCCCFSPCSCTFSLSSTCPQGLLVHNDHLVGCEQGLGSYFCFLRTCTGTFSFSSTCPEKWLLYIHTDHLVGCEFVLLLFVLFLVHVHAPSRRRVQRKASIRPRLCGQYYLPLYPPDKSVSLTVTDRNVRLTLAHCPQLPGFVSGCYSHLQSLIHTHV